MQDEFVESDWIWNAILYISLSLEWNLFNDLSMEDDDTHIYIDTQVNM